MEYTQPPVFMYWRYRPWYHALLRGAGLDHASVTRVEPLRSGLGGGQLWRLSLSVPIVRSAPHVSAALGGTSGGQISLGADVSGARWSARRIVKVIAPLDGWLSVTSADVRVREVSLWSSGLLADLPHRIRTGVVAWQAGWHAPVPSPTGEQDWKLRSALLMRDETARLWRRPLRTPLGHAPTAISALLDDLARLHAHYWNDPRLDDAHATAIGLTPLRATLLLASPTTVAERLTLGDDNPYLPLARDGWKAFFALANPADATLLQQAFAEPEPYVAAIAALPRTLIHGDVWGPNLGRLPSTHSAPRQGSRTLLLDWALAAAAPATFDPLWLCGVWQTLAPHRILGAYRARLTRHLAARGVALPASVWRALADAGYLRTTLTCGEAFGRAAHAAPAGPARRQAEERARWWAARGAHAALRLRIG